MKNDFVDTVNRAGTIHDSLNRFLIQNPISGMNCESAIRFAQRIDSFHSYKIGMVGINDGIIF